MTGLTIATMGGIHTTRMWVNLFAPFSEKTGIGIKDVSYNAFEFDVKSTIMPDWDIIDLSMAGYYQAVQEQKLAALPLELFSDNGNKFLEDVLLPYGVASIIWSMVFAHNTNAFGDNGPKTVFDVWDIKKFPGMRALPAKADSILEWGLLADGISRDQVYALLATDVGAQRAINKIKEIESNILWMPDYGAVVDVVVNGKAVIGLGPCGRFSYAKKHDKPITISWDHQKFGYNYWGVLESSKNKDSAFAFIKFAMHPTVHARHLNDVHYGAVCAKAQGYINPEGVHFMPMDPINCKTSLRHDPKLWAKQGDELQNQFLSAFRLESIKAA